MRFRASVRLLLFGLLAAASVTVTAHAGLNNGDLALYRHAYADAKAGQWDQAWSLANQAHDRFPAKLLRWIELTRDPPPVTFAQIHDFLEHNPSWPDRVLMRLHAEAKLKDQSDAVAAEWFRQFPPLTIAAKVREVGLMISSGHRAEGIARLREIWIDDDFSTAEARDFLARYGDYLQPQDQARRLDRLIWTGRYAAARGMLPRVDPGVRALGAARLALLSGAPDAEHLLDMVPPSLEKDPGLIFARLRWRQKKEYYAGAVALLDHPPADLVRPQAWIVE
ncbi:MAG: hypothetical protein ACREE3_12845, partial [Stellaceae bacterium]